MYINSSQRTKCVFVCVCVFLVFVSCMCVFGRVKSTKTKLNLHPVCFNLSICAIFFPELQLIAAQWQQAQDTNVHTDVRTRCMSESSLRKESSVCLLISLLVSVLSCNPSFFTLQSLYFTALSVFDSGSYFLSCWQLIVLDRIVWKQLNCITIIIITATKQVNEGERGEKLKKQWTANCIYRIYNSIQFFF